MSTEYYYEKRKIQHTCFEENTLSNDVDSKLAEEAENNKFAGIFSFETHLQPTFRAWRSTGIVAGQARNKC